MFVSKNRNRAHMLWSKTHPYGPFMCEKPDWKKCLDHKHLTETRPDIIMTVELKFDNTGQIVGNVTKVELVGNEEDSSTVEAELVLDALLEAKNKTPRGDRVYYFRGKPYTIASLIELGIPKDRITSVLSDFNSGLNDKQHEPRVEFLLVEYEFLEQLSKIENKQWRDETILEKKTYYDVELTRLRYIKDRISSSYKRIIESIEEMGTANHKELIATLPETAIMNKVEIVWNKVTSKYDDIEISFL